MNWVWQPRSIWIGLLLVVAPLMRLAAAERPPNFLVILADDVGQEVLGCYGGESYKTPNLDRLAASGIRFRHCYSMPVCHPTRVCLLTGRYPERLGNPKWGSFPKADEKRTLASVLKQAGYATAVAGKWQLALLKNQPLHPHRLGFDEYTLFGWHEGPRYWQPLIWQNGAILKNVADRYGPDVYVDSLIDFMTRKRDKPFLAFYSMALCHDVTDDLKNPVPFGPGKDRYESYGEMAAAMDASIGRLLEALDRLKLREKTLVLFLGDNGTPSRYYARVEKGKLVREKIVSRQNGRSVPGGKGKLTDTGTRVPLLASWPGKVGPGQVVDDLIDMSDFLPTLAELASARLPKGVRLDGHSFAGRILGAKPTTRGWAYAAGRGRRFVRTQRWKLYDNGKLFDLESDPGESQPVKPSLISPESRATYQTLQAALERLAADAR